MKFKNLASFKFKLFKPCKKLIHLFKFKLHKPVFIRALKFRQQKAKLIKKTTTTTTTKKGRLPKILSFFHSLRNKREMDRLTELKSFSDAGYHKAPYSSPLTPAYVRMSAASIKEISNNDNDDDVEDACRSFENYLIEMIVEEGRMRDLVDVEELLYCWKNLRCPVFMDLVCRFYGELCKDLFSNE